MKLKYKEILVKYEESQIDRNKMKSLVDSLMTENNGLKEQLDLISS